MLPDFRFSAQISDFSTDSIRIRRNFNFNPTFFPPSAKRSTVRKKRVVGKVLLSYFQQSKWHASIQISHVRGH
ncbi:hypothetical protein SLEP1_g33004 [Rubroshorea leprosula]|uniref:Uncharacterized protein n=1 Tax=Rubroshorea leprosula TaxID=152421 RepID=A0AAV5KF73_9ROSI|nr:hypothetical protein SLEP1_g33004 [Rubroshorea leprosula]